MADQNKGMSDLWRRLRFVFMAIVVYRLGTHIPIPGIDPARLAALFDQNQGTILEMFNLFSGCLLYTSPSPRDATLSRMPSSA